jgi:hypothetical protein
VVRTVKKALTAPDLTATATLGAGFHPGSRGCARSLTIRTGFGFFHINLFFHAKRRFHERQLHVVTQVGAPMHATPRTAPTAKAEKIFEDITETGKDILEAAKTGKSRPFQALVAILVINLPFFGIPEDIVGLGGLLEFLFSTLITWVFVGMKF